MRYSPGVQYIGEQIKWFEQKRFQQLCFRFEESYVRLAGTHARDKEPVCGDVLCEMRNGAKRMALPYGSDAEAYEIRLF